MFNHSFLCIYEKCKNAHSAYDIEKYLEYLLLEYLVEGVFI